MDLPLPLPNNSNPNEKKTRVRLNIEDQLEIVRRFENGEKRAHIAKDLGLHDTSVRCIIKRREKLNR